MGRDVPQIPETASGIRLAELMAALSLGTDLGMGQPLEYALCSCILAVRIGDALVMGPAELRAVYYQALLRYIGCNAETHAIAALFGDELALRADYATVDPGRSRELLAFVLRSLRRANAGARPLPFIGAMVQGLMASAATTKVTFAGHCEVAQRLATRLGFESSIVEALGQLYERWDGRGLPRGLEGEAIAPAVRVVAFAQDAITFHRLGGLDSVLAMARKRSAKAYDPRVVETFCVDADGLFAGLDDEPSWEAVLAIEPGPRQTLTSSEVDEACTAIADFADLKSSYTLGHSRGVAELAEAAARAYGLPASDVTDLHRAALLHDVGRVGISAVIWDKPGPLTASEWERVRLHSYYTERILARPPSLASIGEIAALHHERLDGSGYHRRARAAALPLAARIVAAADVYHAMTEPRPHRSARSADEAAAELRREARHGRLDADAVAAILAAAGHRTRPVRREMVAGLTGREIEVLRLIARGSTIRQASNVLEISEKTVDNHLQHIYSKIGVSTRAGATLFALEQNLLHGDDEH